MSKFLRWLFGGLVTILLLMLGIERTKNKKKDEVIKEQAVAIESAEKDADIQKTGKDATVAVFEAMEEKERAQKKEEMEIEEAKTDEEVIAIANDIIGRFNTK